MPAAAATLLPAAAPPASGSTAEWSGQSECRWFQRLACHKIAKRATDDVTDWAKTRRVGKPRCACSPVAQQFAQGPSSTPIPPAAASRLTEAAIVRERMASCVQRPSLRCNVCTIEQAGRRLGWQRRRQRRRLLGCEQCGLRAAELRRMPQIAGSGRGQRQRSLGAGAGCHPRCPGGRTQTFGRRVPNCATRSRPRLRHRAGTAARARQGRQGGPKPYSRLVLGACSQCRRRSSRWVGDWGRPSSVLFLLLAVLCCDRRRQAVCRLPPPWQSSGRPQQRRATPDQRQPSSKCNACRPKATHRPSP